MAKFSCEIKKLLVLGADPSFLLKKMCISCFVAIMDKAREEFPHVSDHFAKAYDESRAQWVLLSSTFHISICMWYRLI